MTYKTVSSPSKGPTCADESKIPDDDDYRLIADNDEDGTDYWRVRQWARRVPGARRRALKMASLGRLAAADHRRGWGGHSPAPASSTTRPRIRAQARTSARTSAAWWLFRPRARYATRTLRAATRGAKDALLARGGGAAALQKSLSAGTTKERTPVTRLHRMAELMCQNASYYIGGPCRSRRRTRAPIRRCWPAARHCCRFRRETAPTACRYGRGDDRVSAGSRGAARLRQLGGAALSKSHATTSPMP